jgi:hypothetical protein
MSGLIEFVVDRVGETPDSVVYVYPHLNSSFAMPNNNGVFYFSLSPSSEAVILEAALPGATLRHTPHATVLVTDDDTDLRRLGAPRVLDEVVRIDARVTGVCTLRDRSGALLTVLELDSSTMTAQKERVRAIYSVVGDVYPAEQHFHVTLCAGDATGHAPALKVLGRTLSMQRLSYGTMEVGVSAVAARDATCTGTA